MKILVFGTFDLLHPGHRFLLDEAKKRGALHVVVGRDATVEKIKGHLPIHNEVERMAAIAKAYPEVTVHLGHASDYLARIREIQPDLILLGYDQRMPSSITEDMLGAPVERIPAFEPHIYKSSLLKEKNH